MVGCGGNGSIFVTHLCRIYQAWTKLGGEAFSIRLVDPDAVTEANLGRQVFCEADIGVPKAEVLAQRCRAFFGIECESDVGEMKNHNYHPSDLFVGCVDNLKARREMRAANGYGRQRYWLDLGNGPDSGQVILGGHGLPDFFDLFPGKLKAKENKSLPSCSMAESLERQDLFINSTIATLGAQLLWQMMRRGFIQHHGYFVNLSSGRVNPIAVPQSSLQK